MKNNTEENNVGHALKSDQKGITLIALIITIIIMLILAGIVLSITLGENGLIKITKYAVQKNSEETAREKLELALADLISHKYTNENYNENEYINNYLKNEDMTVVDNVVTVDNWNFEIDRSVPCIKTNLGALEIKLTKEVKEYLGKNENDKYMVAVLVKIESNTKIESIEFENTDGTTLTVKAEKETLEKDMQIELDREYKVVVKMANGKSVNRTIIEKSVENIKTAEELAEFRNKVNSGLTYEGKIINLLNDIDLSNICGENINGQEVSWEPIGTDKTYFKGIFDGKNFEINNIYINTAKDAQGLFKTNDGIIQNIGINGIMITKGNVIGGISAINNNKIINCYNNSYIKANICAGGICGYITRGTVEKCYNTGEIYVVTSAAGIAASCRENSGAIVKECYNTGHIHADEYTAGGIVGFTKAGSIYNCYNIGNINAKLSNAGGISGSTGSTGQPKVYIYNCYNIGNITSKAAKDQIMGKYNIEGSAQAVNCYTTNVTAELLNTGQYSDNEWINDVKVKDEETGEKWKYNKGYPILKWQLEN